MVNLTLLSPCTKWAYIPCIYATDSFPLLYQCALGAQASQHTHAANWDLTFLMTAFNTALWISFPEKVSVSEAELFVQNMCKNEASPAYVVTYQNTSKLWWKNFATRLVSTWTVSASETKNLSNWNWSYFFFFLFFFFANSKKQGEAFMLYLFI